MFVKDNIIKDVSAMTKEKTALVIPNAIQICTSNEKLFFCSFTARDKAHVTLFKVTFFATIGLKSG